MSGHRPDDYGTAVSRNLGQINVQQLVGSLQGKRARKGIFITTGKFSAAEQFPEYADLRCHLRSRSFARNRNRPQINLLKNIFESWNLYSKTQRFQDSKNYFSVSIGTSGMVSIRHHEARVLMALIRKIIFRLASSDFRIA